MNLKETFLSLKERALTAVVLLAAVFGVAIIDNAVLTWLFFGIIYMFAFYEAMKLFGISNNSFYVYALSVWLAALIYPRPEDIIYPVLIAGISIMVHKKELDLKLLSPFVYPTLSMLFLYGMYKSFGMYSLVWLVAIVASADTGAYLAGKSFGKTPFSKTSPNKTWEGVAGGVLIASAVGSLVGLGITSLVASFVISLLVALSSVWGDLFESYLKREAGVKDSGAIFPGHGGMLDRIDGYMFGVVIMFVLLRGLQ